MGLHTKSDCPFTTSVPTGLLQGFSGHFWTPLRARLTIVPIHHTIKIASPSNSIANDQVLHKNHSFVPLVDYLLPFEGGNMMDTLRPRWMQRPLLLYYLYSLLFLLGACSSPAPVRPSHIDIFQPLGTMLYTYNGHINAISDLAWSPDGARIASASYDKTLQVWDAATGKRIVTYRKHSNWVTAVAWSPDGTSIASASVDKTVQIWNASTGKRLLFYTGASDWVNSVAWSPDGLRIASANKNDTVQIWSAVRTRDTNMYEPLLTYRGHHSEVLTAVWSPDSMHIASGGDDGLVQVWEAE